MGFNAYLDDWMIRYCRETIGRRSRVVMDTIRGACGSVSKVGVGSSSGDGLFWDSFLFAPLERLEKLGNPVFYDLY